MLSAILKQSVKCVPNRRLYSIYNIHLCIPAGLLWFEIWKKKNFFVVGDVNVSFSFFL